MRMTSKPPAIKSNVNLRNFVELTVDKQLAIIEALSEDARVALANELVQVVAPPRPFFRKAPDIEDRIRIISPIVDSKYMILIVSEYAKDKFHRDETLTYKITA